MKLPLKNVEADKGKEDESGEQHKSCAMVQILKHRPKQEREVMMIVKVESDNTSFTGSSLLHRADHLINTAQVLGRKHQKRIIISRIGRHFQSASGMCSNQLRNSSWAKDVGLSDIVFGSLRIHGFLHHLRGSWIEELA